MYKIKPTYYKKFDKFETFILTGIFSTAIALFSCFADMLIFDKSMSDPVADWIISLTKALIYGFPLTWIIVHQMGRVKYYFKSYRPWKKQEQAYIKRQDSINLDRERKLTEVFIREVRRK